MQLASSSSSSSTTSPIMVMERLALDCCSDAVMLASAERVLFCNRSFGSLFSLDSAAGLANQELSALTLFKPATPLSVLVQNTLHSMAKTEGVVASAHKHSKYKVICTPLSSSDSVCCIFTEILGRDDCLEILDEHSPLLVQIFEQDRQSGDILYHFVSKKARSYQPVDNYKPQPSPVGRWLSQTAAYLPKEERDWWMTNIRQISSVGASARFERSIPLPTGETLAIAVLAKNIGLTSEGNFKYFVIIDDLTGMKKLQDELTRTGETLSESIEQASLWKMLVEQTPVPIGLVRPCDGDRDIEMLFMNPATGKNWGIGPEFLPKIRYFSEVGVDAHVAEFWLQKYREAERAAHPIEFETEGSNGVWWNCWVKHISGDRFAFVCSDISARVRYEQKLKADQARLEQEMAKRTNELEEAMQVKSRFLAVMSHEIRTPLSGIIGSMSLLSEQRLSSEQRDVVNLALLCGEQLLVVINDILDHSRLEENKVHLERAPFSLHDTIEEAIEIISLGAYKKGLELVCDIADGTQEIIVGDQARIRQILVNLLSNAVKFTNNGEISVRVSSRVVTTSKMQVISEIPSHNGNGNNTTDDECLVEISVEDTGIGIEPKTLENLFQPFVQADSSMSRKFGGSGLGLHICKRLVELMGGDIVAKSTLGKGSVFTFTIRSPISGQKSSSQLSTASIARATPQSSPSASPSLLRRKVVNSSSVSVVPAALPSLGLLPVVIIERNQTLRNLLLRKSVSWGYQTTAFESVVNSDAVNHLFQLASYSVAGDAKKNSKKRKGAIEKTNSSSDVTTIAAVVLMSTNSLMEVEAFSSSPTTPSTDRQHCSSSSPKFSASDILKVLYFHTKVLLMGHAQLHPLPMLRNSGTFPNRLNTSVQLFNFSSSLLPPSPPTAPANPTPSEPTTTLNTPVASAPSTSSSLSYSSFSSSGSSSSSSRTRTEQQLRDELAHLRREHHQLQKLHADTITHHSTAFKNQLPLLSSSTRAYNTRLNKSANNVATNFNFAVPASPAQNNSNPVSATAPSTTAPSSGSEEAAAEEITVDHLLSAATFVRKPIRDRALRDELARGTAARNRKLLTASLDASQSNSAPTQTSANRILVAEDNNANQVIIKKLLESLGFRNIDVVSNGKEAILAVKARHYDVVLMDVMMPEVSGLEATTAIRKDVDPLHQPKIIAITANAFQEDRNKCLSSGMDSVITKPIRKKELADVLQKALNLPELNS